MNIKLMESITNQMFDTQQKIFYVKKGKNLNK